MSTAKQQKPNVVAWVLTLAIGLVAVWLLASMFTGRNEAVREAVAPSADEEAAAAPEVDLVGKEADKEGNQPALQY